MGGFFDKVDLGLLFVDILCTFPSVHSLNIEEYVNHCFYMYNHVCMDDPETIFMCFSRINMKYKYGTDFICFSQLCLRRSHLLEYLLSTVPFNLRHLQIPQILIRLYKELRYTVTAVVRETIKSFSQGIHRVPFHSMN